MYKNLLIKNISPVFWTMNGGGVKWAYMWPFIGWECPHSTGATGKIAHTGGTCYSPHPTGDFVYGFFSLAHDFLKFSLSFNQQILWFPQSISTYFLQKNTKSIPKMAYS